MTKNVRRLRSMSLAELAQERSFLAGDTRQDDELTDELKRRQTAYDELYAASRIARRALDEAAQHAERLQLALNAVEEISEAIA